MGLWLGVGAGALGAPASAWARAERPAALAVGEGCELWRGTTEGGNDPTVLLELEVCRGPDGLFGRTQWSSTRSGWSVRRWTGAEVGTRWTLVEHELVAQQPEPGWRFCTIDELVLDQAAPGVRAGRYVSTACADEATVRLEKIAPEDPGAGSGRDRPAPSPSAPAPEPATPEPPGPVEAGPPPSGGPSSGPQPEARGCGCTLGRPSPLGLAAIGWLWGSGPRRRRTLGATGR